MNTLLVYGTTEGHTLKVAEFIANRLRSHGCSVTLRDSANEATNDISAFDRVLVAASLHAGTYQAPLRQFASDHAAALRGKHNAFFSVSLTAAEADEEERKGLNRCVAEFAAESGWKPQAVHHVAGAFRYTQYDFFKRWIMKRIAKEHGVPVDTSRDWELTDWNALAEIVDGLVAANDEVRPRSKTLR